MPGSDIQLLRLRDVMHVEFEKTLYGLRFQLCNVLDVTTTQIATFVPGMIERMGHASCEMRAITGNADIEAPAQAVMSHPTVTNPQEPAMALATTTAPRIGPQATRAPNRQESLIGALEGPTVLGRSGQEAARVMIGLLTLTSSVQVRGGGRGGPRRDRERRRLQRRCIRRYALPKVQYKKEIGNKTQYISTSFLKPKGLHVHI